MVRVAQEIIVPVDHYVSKVHLKKFCSPELDGKRMYAIRKSDMKAFAPGPRNVCGISEGSTNAYLRESRAVEEFLKTIEPNYDSALAGLKSGKIDLDCIYTIAGFVAYVAGCSPGGMRIHAAPLKSNVEVVAANLEAKGAILPPPPQLGGATLTDLLKSGKVELTIDPKFPQAMAINTILQGAVALGNFKWEVLHNGFEENPFFTSDYPAAIESTADPKILNRIIPLAPDLALRIRPDPIAKRDDWSFASFGYQSRKIHRREVVQINRQIVRCAEDVVFFRDEKEWVRRFVERNRHYRIEAVTTKIPASSGTYLWTKLQVRQTPT